MQKEKLKPDRLMALLRQQGTTISPEQAVMVLLLLRKLARMAVKQYLQQ